MSKHGKHISELAAIEIVKEVGSLSLVIRQIGSYIAATDIASDRFLNLYQSRLVASHVDA